MTIIKSLSSFSMSDNFLKRKYYFTRKTIVSLLIHFGNIGLYLMLMFALMKGNMSIAVFLLLISYYTKTKESIDIIMGFDASIRDESVSLDRVKELIDYGNNMVQIKMIILLAL